MARPPVRTAQRSASATQQPPGGAQTNPGQPAPGVNRAAAQRGVQPAPLTPRAPFELTAEQQKALDEVLVEWERRSEKIARFKCTFVRRDYNQNDGPKVVPKGRDDLLHLKANGAGEIKYKAPDHGTYKLTKFEEYVPENGATTLRYEDNPAAHEHWVCDGDAIYQFRPKEKQLIETRLPDELKGKAISDGPLPFIFGAKAETLKKRYWLRITTPPENAQTQVWIEAYPKFQQDAANFSKVDLILDKENFLPVAMQIHTPGIPARTVYMFGKPSINALLGALDFASPMTPIGWKRIVEHAPGKKDVEPPKVKEETARKGKGAFFR